MIIELKWRTQINGGLTTKYYRGWFIFGIIPVYISITTV